MARKVHPRPGGKTPRRGGKKIRSATSRPHPSAPPKGSDDFENAFAHHYARTMSAARAYLEARGGRVKYSTAASEGPKLLKIPRVASLVREIQEEARAGLKLDRDRIVAELWETHLEGRGAPPPDELTGGKKGRVVIATRNLGASVGALEKIAKILGLIVEKQEVKHKGSGVFLVPSATDPAAWAKMAAGYSPDANARAVGGAEILRKAEAGAGAKRPAPPMPHPAPPRA